MPKANPNPTPATEFRCIEAREQRVAREEGKPPRLEGYAATFNDDSRQMVDGRGRPFIERIAPGAFTNTIKTADVRAAFNHDANLVLGRTKAGTLRLVEDSVGLRYECDINPNDTAAMSAAAKVERQDVDGCSFKFRTVRDSWSVENGVNIRTLLEVDLIDVGPVTFPAYESTSVDVRSLAEAVARGRLSASEARGMVQYEDGSFRWQCRYLIAYLRSTFDYAQSVIEAVAAYDDEITASDQQAADDCFDLLADVQAKLKLCRDSLRNFGAQDPADPTAVTPGSDAGANATGDDADDDDATEEASRSATPHYDRLRLLQMQAAAESAN